MDADTPYRVQAVQVHPEGVEVHYLRLSDIKENGVVIKRVLMVPFDADYNDEIERMAEAIETLIADVEDDEEVLEPWQPHEQDEDDEDAD